MILVTGGTGLVGSHLLYALITNGEKVRAIHRNSSNLDAVKNVFSFYTNDPQPIFDKIEWMEADITDVPSLIPVFKDINSVYHCAAYISFNPRHFSTLKKVNVEGTANIVNLCLSQEMQKLCYVSSIATLGRTINGSMITEENDYNPEDNNSVYTITKQDAEMEVWRGTQEGLDAVIVNPGVIIGEGIWSAASGSILHASFKGIKYFTSGGMGMVDVQDVVKAMILLSNSSIKNNNYLLVGANISYRDFQSKLAINLNKKAPYKLIAMRKLLFLSNMDWLLNKVFKTKRRLLKATVTSLYNESYYDATKIKNELSFEFRNYEQTLERVCRNYLRDFN